MKTRRRRVVAAQSPPQLFPVPRARHHGSPRERALELALLDVDEDFIVHHRSRDFENDRADDALVHETSRALHLG